MTKMGKIGTLFVQFVTKTVDKYTLWGAHTYIYDGVPLPLWDEHMVHICGNVVTPFVHSLLEVSRPLFWHSVFLSFEFLICFYWQLWPFNARSVLTFRETRDPARVTVSLARRPAVRTLIDAWPWECHILFWAPSRSGTALLASRVTRTVNSTVS